MLGVILVTGAAGFIGSHFGRLAHESGRVVVGVDDYSGTPQRTPARHFEIVEQDVGVSVRSTASR